MALTSVLPIIDISNLSSPQRVDRIAVATAIDDACQQYGFLYIRGEQFDPLLFQSLFAVAKTYFAQDEASKMRHYIGQSVNHSGYVPIGEEQFSSGHYDLKEAYDINLDYQADDVSFPLVGPTQWPDDAEFCQQVSRYYQHIKTIGQQIFSAFALALGKDEQYFMAHTQRAPSQLRLIHYPYHPDIVDHDGIGAHTDYECFTLLLPTAPGLQILDKQGQWVDVPLLEHTLIMNIGDMMEILSNGRYKATKHRVKKVSEERYSFPFFFSCDYDYVIAPITDEAPRYSPLIGGEHLFNQTAQTFAYLKAKVANGDISLTNARPLHSFGLAEQQVTITDNAQGVSDAS